MKKNHRTSSLGANGELTFTYDASDKVQTCYISDNKWITKTVLLELKQSGADIVGRTIGSYYPWAAREGEDMLNLY